jgi:hypothetical protein
MASVEDCERALHRLAANLAGADPVHRAKANIDRTLTCKIIDLAAVFAGRLFNGELLDIRRVEAHDGQVRLALGSDDLIQLVAGELNLAAAWASGRIRIDARVFDLIKIRSFF